MNGEVGDQHVYRRNLDDRTIRNLSRKNSREEQRETGLHIEPTPIRFVLGALVQRLTKECERVGAFTGPAKARIGVSHQAYADDIFYIEQNRRNTNDARDTI